MMVNLQWGTPGASIKLIFQFDLLRANLLEGSNPFAGRYVHEGRMYFAWQTSF